MKTVHRGTECAKAHSEVHFHSCEGRKGENSLFLRLAEGGIMKMMKDRGYEGLVRGPWTHEGAQQQSLERMMRNSQKEREGRK